MKKIEMAGKIFNKIKIIDFSHKSKNKNIIWNCVCYCGNSFKASGYSIRTNHTKSCGCIKKVTSAENGKKSSRWKTNNRQIYRTWSNMLDRCYNISNKDYATYGGKGISVYEEWKNDFDKFCFWITNNLGAKPSKTYTLDRINSYKNYEPGNLRWATREEQAQNKTTTKLNKQKIVEIRQSSLSRQDLVKKYNVEISQINKILGKRAWKNI